MLRRFRSAFLAVFGGSEMEGYETDDICATWNFMAGANQSSAFLLTQVMPSPQAFHSLQFAADCWAVGSRMQTCSIAHLVKLQFAMYAGLAGRTLPPISIVFRLWTLQRGPVKLCIHHTFSSR